MFAQEMFGRFIKLNPHHLIWMGVVVSIGITEIIVFIMSTHFHGRITRDYVITGTLTAFIVSLLVLSVVIHFVSKLRESEERFRRVFDSAPIGMLIVDQGREIVKTNEAFCAMLGYVEKELLGRTLDDITYTEDMEKSQEASRELLGGKTPRYHMEKRYLKKNGEMLWVKLTATAIHERNGKVLYGLGMTEDLTERVENEKKIRFLAHYDELTELPNRTLLKKLLNKAVLYAQRHRTTMALLFIDLDYFKRINDSLGYDSGDQLLQDVADRLLKAIRKSDCVARLAEEEMTHVLSRLGGDEFILLLQNISNILDAGKVSRRILKDVAKPFVIGGREVFITASIGISSFPSDGKDADELLKNADVAMYQAKEKGRNCYQFYSKAMNATALELLTLEQKLHKAMEQQEFVLYYQPKLDALDQRIIGLEALVRWQNAEIGFISPTQFIPLAEESGLIIPIGEWILHAVCLQNKAWQDAGFKNMKVAVNLSARQFDQPDLIQTITRALDNARLDPKCLELEITESTIMKNPEDASTILGKLKSMGVEISIDDFGTGHSSLGYLRRLPVSYLKIDRSFVMNITTNPNDASIVTAIIALAHTLNLKVVAEGVETQEQLLFLREHGCDEMQGFLFSRPLPAEDISKLLSKKYL